EGGRGRRARGGGGAPPPRVARRRGGGGGGGRPGGAARAGGGGAPRLYEITGRLASSLELDRILDFITAKTLELLTCEASGIYTYDESRGGLRFLRGLNLDPRLTSDLVLEPGEGIPRPAFQARRPAWPRGQPP